MAQAGSCSSDSTPSLGTSTCCSAALKSKKKKKKKKDVFKKRIPEDTNKINERADITIDTTDIQRIIRDCYEKLYANKLDNLGEMDNFLEIHKLSRLNHGKIENLNRMMTSKEIDSVT